MLTPIRGLEQHQQQRTSPVRGWRSMAAALGLLFTPLALAPLLATTACSGLAAQAAVPPTLASVQSLQGGKCSLASKQPFAIDWAASERGNLESHLRKGVTAVKYTGCALEVIDRCGLKRESKYAYMGLSPKQEVHSFGTTDELYAHMPVGAQKFEGSLKASGHLDLRMTIAGRMESSASSVRMDDLEGEDCAHATHFVRAISVGAFRFESGAEATVGGSVITEKLAMGGKGSAKKEALTADGDEAACKSGSESDTHAPRNCGALLRLELLAIDGHMQRDEVVKTERVCPPGETWNGTGCAGGDGKASTGRFAVRGGAVFDTTTGLSWQRAQSPKHLSWDGAKAYCAALLEGDGWRLPKKSELHSLVGSKRSAPWVDTAAFPGAPPTKFWSSSEDRGSPGDAWTVDFGQGSPRSTGSGTELDVRCVR